MKPGVDGRFNLVCGHMFYIHVGSESVPHHRCGARDGPLTPCRAGPRDFEEKVRHYSFRSALTPPPRNLKDGKIGVCCTWALCSIVRPPTFLGAVRCQVVRGECQGAAGDGVAAVALGQSGVATPGP